MFRPSFLFLIALAALASFPSKSLADCPMAPSAGSNLPELPDQMIRLGFCFEEHPLGDGKYYKLSVPAPFLSAYSTLTQPNGQALPGSFNRIVYTEQGAETVHIELGTTNGETFDYLVDLNRHEITVEGRENGKVNWEKQTMPYIPEASAVSFIETKKQQRDERNKAPDKLTPELTLMSWDGPTKKLRVKEQRAGGEVVRDVALRIPEGIDIQIVGDRFLVMTDRTGPGFKDSNRVVIDVATLPGYTRDKADCIGGTVQTFEAHVADGTGAFLQGSIDTVVGYFLAQVRENDADARGGTTRDGFTRMRSDTRRSSLFIRDRGPGTQPEFAPGAGWNPICSLKVQPKADKSLALELKNDFADSDTYTITPDLRNFTYSAQQTQSAK